MPFYESVFIARQDLSPAQVEALTGDISAIVKKNGGKVTKTEQWGLRSLTFRIRKNKKGHYVLLNIDAPPAAVQEMERTMRINEDVLRTLTIRVEELEEGPSVVLRKSNDDERPTHFGARPERSGGSNDRSGGFRPRPQRTREGDSA